MLDHEQIELLEEACEEALATVVQRFPEVSDHPELLHLMAKAAVTVIEAAQPVTPPPRGKRR